MFVGEKGKVNFRVAEEGTIVYVISPDDDLQIVFDELENADAINREENDETWQVPTAPVKLKAKGCYYYYFLSTKYRYEYLYIILIID